MHAGHSHPRWLQAVNEQAATLTHTSNLFHTEAGVSRHPSSTAVVSPFQVECATFLQVHAATSSAGSAQTVLVFAFERIDMYVCL